MWLALLSGIGGAVAAPFALKWRWGPLLLAAIPALVAVHLLRLAPSISLEPTAFALPWIPGLELSLRLRLDGLSLLFGVVVAVVATAIQLYSPAYLAGHTRRARFCALLFLFQSAMLGLVFADDLLLLFCFWEATSILSYLLVGFDSEQKEARVSAQRAVLVTGLGGLALLAGLLLLGDAAGTLQLSELAGRSERILADARLPAIVVLVLLGAFTKSAQFPFHFWLPGAMTAPTPASAFLHAATMVKAGIYLLLRLAPVLGESPLWSDALVSVGGLTAVLGGCLAPFQTYVKRLLAYTTISALGTLVLLIGIGGEVALQAALAFLVAHALYKGALFLAAGTIAHATHEKQFERLGGLLRPMRWTGAAALLGALAMAGLPPTLGFVGKEGLFRATFGSTPAVLAAALVAAAPVAAAAFVFFHRSFLGRPRGAAAGAHEGSPALVAAPLGLAVLALALGPLAGALDDALLAPALAAMGAAAAPERLALWHGFDRALAMEGLALGTGALVVLLLGRLASLGAGLSPLSKLGPTRAYDLALTGVYRAGTAASRAWGRNLREGLITMLLGALVLIGWPLLHGLRLPLAEPAPRAAELATAALVVAGVVVSVISRTRMATVASLGAAGCGIALLFTFFGAPDLAMTQFVVETLVVVLFVLAFHRLPRYRPAPSRLVRTMDAGLAVWVGAMMTGLVLLALDAELAPSGSQFYIDNAARAHGLNVVNLILSDFRALDTLGEITVLGVAGIGISALFRRRDAERAA